MTDENNDRSTNVVWHEHRVAHEDRVQRLGQKPGILWFTGLSGSGKSTLANALEASLFEQERLTYVLDGDNIRHGLNRDLGFTDEARVENIRRIGEVAKLFVDAGVIVLTAFISPFRADREIVRSLVEPGQFIEIHARAPLDVCEQRDPKGLYKKARAGEIPHFTGIDSPYEAPENPELIVDTADHGLEACVAQISDALRERGMI